MKTPYIAIKRNGIELVDPPPEVARAFKSALTITNPAYVAAIRNGANPRFCQIPPKLVFMRKLDGRYYLPRGIEDLQLPDIAREYMEWVGWKDMRVRVPVGFPDRLRDMHHRQRVLFDAYRAARRRFGCFPLIAPTAMGKTVLQAEIAAATGQRTLICSSLNTLTMGWFEDLKAHFGLKRSEVGHIQGPNWRIGDQFTIASIQTLDRNRDKWREIYSKFGTVVVDEGRHVVTRKNFGDFLFFCPAKYIITATATEKKYNDYDKLMRFMFGKPVGMIVEQGETDTSFPLSGVVRIKTNFTYPIDGFVDYHPLMQALAADDERNELAVRQIKADWDEGHCPLVLTKYVEHAKRLQALLIFRGVSDTALITGESNADHSGAKRLRKQILERRVRTVVATYQAVGIATNLNPLDRLHVMMPIKNLADIEQAIGRIRRKAPGKYDALVYYYYDHQVSYLRRAYEKWAQVFYKLGVKLEDIK